MIQINKKQAKPFVKWAGGKTQLLCALESFLPSNFKVLNNVTYIEPFVGGGAMLFYMVQNYPNIKKSIINDINLNLIITYLTIKENPYKLIERLEAIQSYYKSLPAEIEKKEYFLSIREKFNNSGLSDVERAAYLIFLNRTCFNGLYRENSKGLFNVPFGKYVNPRICDYDLILADSEILQQVTIVHGDFSDTAKFIDKNTFFYLDPPYRPLNATSSFNSYVKEAFNDEEQIRLKEFIDFAQNEGCYILLSNSDCKSKNAEDIFFDELYKNYIIERVYAKRCINANSSKRGILSELVIRNYKDIIGSQQ